MVCNTSSTDSVAIRDHYTEKCPDVRVWNYPGTTSAVSITRDLFDTEIRGPLNSYLLNTDDGQGNPLWQTVRILVTTKGVPRRIWDIDGTTIGDPDAGMANTQFGLGKYDAASVDAELVLLHQNLKAGATQLPDNYANNFIRNPYHRGEERITTYTRENATTVKMLSWYTPYTGSPGWGVGTGNPKTRLTPGDIYLVCRLSAYTSDEVESALARSGIVPVDKTQTTVILDRDGVRQLDDDDPYGDGHVDYPGTRDMLQAAGFHATYDETSLFIVTSSRDVLGYASYGFNHIPSPGAHYVINLDPDQFPIYPGAIFNTYESWNGTNFESPPGKQGQVADWLRKGGTLGIGHVFEPFSFSVADNEVLYERMLLRGWTYAEAAYASLPVLSWQHVVVGDPLTTFYPLGQALQWYVGADHGPIGTVATPVDDDYIEPRLQGIHTLVVLLDRQADPASLTAGTITIIGQRTGDQSSWIDAAWLDGTGTVLSIHVQTPAGGLPDADRYTVTLTSALKDAAGYPFTGKVELRLSALAGDVDGSGTVTGADMLPVRGAAGAALDSLTAPLDVDASGEVGPADILAVRAAGGHTLP